MRAFMRAFMPARYDIHRSLLLRSWSETGKVLVHRVTGSRFVYMEHRNDKIACVGFDEFVDIFLTNRESWRPLPWYNFHPDEIQFLD